MTGKFKDTKRRTLINTMNNIWCPYCDWHVSDSMASRRRLGVHLSNYHYRDIAFVVGTQPEIEE